MPRRRCEKSFPFSPLEPFKPDLNMTPQDCRSKFRFFHSLRVRWVEVDMQKIVFNGHYLMYFDTAISDYWRALGLSYEKAMQQLGGDLYVKKASVEYHGSARFDDRLEVALRCARIGNSSLTFSGVIFRDSALLVSCELIYVFADPVTQTSKPVPQALRGLLEMFEAGSDMIRIETGGWTTLGADAGTLRIEVFAHEQGIALELVNDAADVAAIHAVAYNGLGQAVATGRVARRDQSVSQLGRLAVCRTLRGSGVGTQVMLALVDRAVQLGDTEVMLHAQRGAQAFYERAGFKMRGEYFHEAGLPHLEFFKRL